MKDPKKLTEVTVEDIRRQQEELEDARRHWPEQLRGELLADGHDQEQTDRVVNFFTGATDAAVESAAEKAHYADVWHMDEKIVELQEELKATKAKLSAQDAPAASASTPPVPPAAVTSQASDGDAATAHQIKQEGKEILQKARRRNLMTPLIEAAQHQCADPLDVPAVFAVLRRWAREKVPRVPLVGATEDGLQWLDDEDELRNLSRKSLGDRLRRLGKAR